MCAGRAAILLVQVAAVLGAGCHKPSAHVPEFVTSPPSHEFVRASSLPLNYSWKRVNGINWLTSVRNQQLPRLCGSCWAVAATGALSDRFYIHTEGRDEAVTLSPQVLLDLSDVAPYAGSCNGGDHHRAYEFIRMHGISDESCDPYQGVDSATWGEHISITGRMCRICDWDGTCGFTDAGPRYRILEHGSVKGVVPMMAEIWKRGPIACAIHAHGTIFNVYTGSPEVMSDDTVYNETTHLIELIGFGQTGAGLKYWEGKNSYGTVWGLKGFFKLRRGHDDLAMESNLCAWAVPDVGQGKKKSDVSVAETKAIREPTTALYF